MHIYIRWPLLARGLEAATSIVGSCGSLHLRSNMPLPLSCPKPGCLVEAGACALVRHLPSHWLYARPPVQLAFRKAAQSVASHAAKQPAASQATTKLAGKAPSFQKPRDSGGSLSISWGPPFPTKVDKETLGSPQDTQLFAVQRLFNRCSTASNRSSTAVEPGATRVQPMFNRRSFAGQPCSTAVQTSAPAHSAPVRTEFNLCSTAVQAPLSVFSCRSSSAFRRSTAFNRCSTIVYSRG